MSDQPAPDRPWLRADYLICGTALGAGVVATYVFLALTPKLLAHHSLLLEAFAGTNAAVVTGGALARVGRESLVLALIAPLLTVALYDVFLWWGGRLWGNAILDLYTRNSPRAARWISRAERLVRRRGVWVLVFSYYLPFPNYIVYLCCGLSGMPLWAFILGDLVGTLLWEALMVGLGWAIGRHAVHIVNAINHYSNYVLIGIVVVVIVMSVLRTRRQLRALPADDPVSESDTGPDIHTGGASRSSQLG
jgi:membrane protein DedA with SNARE-associated domain